jgi:hypothetical protein
MQRVIQALFILAILIASAGKSSAVIVINEVLGSTTGDDAEFIELYNPTGANVDIGGWQVELWDSDSGAIGGADGASPLVIPTGISLAPSGHYLFANSEYNNVFSTTPNQTFSDNGIENSSYTIVLADSGSVVQNSIFVTDGGGGDTANRAGTSITPDATVGPDGTFLPAGFFRTVDGGSTFALQDFGNPASTGTPQSDGVLLTPPPTSNSDLIITGVIDGPLSGGVPKAIELYAVKDIADLSIYGLGSANNGGGSDGEDIALSGSASAGDFIYIASESAGFTSFFGFGPDIVDGDAAINGDDAIELFLNGSVVDVFGDINVDGTGEPWEYADGWAYRVSETGPDGSVFFLPNWFFSGVDALDNETTNATATTPFPIGSFQPAVVPEPASLAIWSMIAGLAYITARRRRTARRS